MLLCSILFPNPHVPSRDEGILAKKCPPGLGNHFLGSRNAFPDQEVIFYPQKVLSRVGTPFFRFWNAIPHRDDAPKPYFP